MASDPVRLDDVANQLIDVFAQSDQPAIVLMVGKDGITMFGYGFESNADVTDTFQAIAAKAATSNYHTVQ